MEKELHALDTRNNTLYISSPYIRRLVFPSIASYHYCEKTCSTRLEAEQSKSYQTGMNGTITITTTLFQPVLVHHYAKVPGQSKYRFHRDRRQWLPGVKSRGWE